MRRIAIVGTRPAKLREQQAEWEAIRDDVARFVRALGHRDVVLVSGGAAGVDTVAEDNFAGALRAIYRADWDRHGKAAGMIRNGTIVADADEVHAWPSSWSRGTWDTIAKARAAGKPVTVHEPWKGHT